MKLLTLNLHCFAEKNLKKNQKIITDFIIEKDIDVCFFQEVGQHHKHKVIVDNIKEGNYVLDLVNILKEKGYHYYMHYDYSKRGFKHFDEGLAIISKTPIYNKNSYHVSKHIDYHNWKTRMNVSCETLYNNKEIVLTSLHLGWTDELEKFEDQFDKTMSNIQTEKRNIIAGDFNVSEGSKEYKHILSYNLTDLYYNNNQEYYHDVTHLDHIDVKKEATRIDYFFGSFNAKTIQREIVFKEKRVSDHFGVYLEIEV